MELQPQPPAYRSDDVSVSAATEQLYNAVTEKQDHNGMHTSTRASMKTTASQQFKNPVNSSVAKKKRGRPKAGIPSVLLTI